MKTDNKQKVVFQLSNNDTFVQKSLIRQLADLLKTMEGITIEVVAYGYGIDLFLEDTPFKTNIKELKNKGVDFLVCGNTLHREKLDSSGLLDFTRIIPAGLAHIIQRQSEGWCYIKAGF